MLESVYLLVGCFVGLYARRLEQFWADWVEIFMVTAYWIMDII